jgi:2-oxoglutarate/2-oxoacid ferredoxin oxidoreductase subunit beta
MTSLKQFDTKEKPSWCPGCGDFSIQSAVKKAFLELPKEKHEFVMVSGIGCGSKTPHWVNTYGFHSIHGRALPVAEGIKLANHKLEVVAIAGDGDAYGIGLNHLMHMMRRNFDMAYIVQDNQVYGLTKGQTSPTSEKGYESRTTPEGVIEEPVNPIKLAVAGGATFVARAFSKDVVQLAELIKKAVNHRGFAIIDVLQPCVTFNKLNTYEYFSSRVYNLADKKYDSSNKVQAFKKSEEWEEKIPIGVIYQEKKKTYIDQLPQIKNKTLLNQSVNNINISKLKKVFQ